MKRFLLNLALFAFSGILAVAMLEVGIRLLMPQYDPSGSIEFRYTAAGVPLGPASVKLRQFKNTGDFDVPVSFNRHGLRDRKDLDDASAGDIFVVGDSFSMGWGVLEEERYSNVLDTLRPEQVFNISIPTDIIGYSRLVDYARDQGAPIRRLVVGICMENDLLEYDALGDEPQRGGQPSVLGHIKGLLTGHSALYLAATSIIHQHRGLRGLAVRFGLIVDNIEGMRRNRYSDAIIDMTARHLALLIDGLDATVVVIPSRGLWVGGNEETEAKVHEAFIARLEDDEVDFLDLRDVFEAHGDPMALHFDYDGHWKPLGHELVGRGLAAHLQRAGTRGATPVRSH